MKLREHTIWLCGEHVLLRPMTEYDWDSLLLWNSDPEVLYDVLLTRDHYETVRLRP